jgi:hypothetical protein
MAALAGAQAQRQWRAGNAVVAGTYLILGVNTNDTLDLSADYRRILHTAFSPTTDAIPFSLPAVAGTTLTFAQAGMTNESGYLFVTGIPL